MTYRYNDELEEEMPFETKKSSVKAPKKEKYKAVIFRDAFDNINFYFTKTTTYIPKGVGWVITYDQGSGETEKAFQARVATEADLLKKLHASGLTGTISS